MKMNQQFSDKTWLKAFQMGNDGAFKAVFDRYNRQLCWFAESRVQNRQEAEDIVAETFNVLWQRHANFDSEEKIKSFLYITTRNACVDFLRQKKRRDISGRELRYLQEDIDDEDILRHRIEAEVLEMIYQDIENLPKKCKTIFKLIFFEGLSTREVAERLRISERNVLNQKARAIQLLKRNLLILIALYLFLPRA